MSSVRASLIPFLVLLGGCATSLRPIPPAWMSAPPAAVAPDLVAALGGSVAPAADPVGIRVVRDLKGARLVRNETDLTPSYPDIESFDVSAERKEVAFSARRKDNRDIGLVSIDGSQVNWIPEEPADEEQPRWAPRGNKVAYFVRNRAGDVIRSVHIPTAFQLMVEFPFGLARTLAWDATGDRFAVAIESADASPRVEVMKYDGTARREAVAPAVRLEASVAPFANGLLLRPRSSPYNESLPLIVWEQSELNAWSDARGRLLQNVRAACLVLERITDETWKEITAAPWVGKVFVVSGRQAPAPAHAIAIYGDPAVPGGRYRRAGNLISADPAVVESLAGRLIEDQLKGTPLRGPR